MIGLDTNILVRYLTQDDAKQAKKASHFIQKNCTTKAPGFINHIVLCELVWVLSGGYGYSRKVIAQTLETLLQVSELEIEYSDVLWDLIELYQSSKADFSDILIAYINQNNRCETTYTFDKAAAKIDGMKLL